MPFALNRSTLQFAWGLLIAAGCALPVQAAPDGQIPDTPQGTVIRLYYDYAWQAIGLFNDMTGMEQQSLPELEKYFDKGLARLIRQDYERTRKTGEIGKLNFIIIFASQDAAATELEISPPDKKNVVKIRFTYPSNGQVIKLDYKMVKTAAGWRIQDIYDEGNHYWLRSYLGG